MEYQSLLSNFQVLPPPENPMSLQATSAAVLFQPMTINLFHLFRMQTSSSPSGSGTRRSCQSSHTGGGGEGRGGGGEGRRVGGGGGEAVGWEVTTTGGGDGGGVVRVRVGEGTVEEASPCDMRASLPVSENKPVLVMFKTYSCMHDTCVHRCFTLYVFSTSNIPLHNLVLSSCPIVQSSTPSQMTASGTLSPFEGSHTYSFVLPMSSQT